LAQSLPKDQSTEQRILHAAKTVFYRKGLGGARMEEIAREAGINKALLHYYFRNKEQLFERIFLEAFEQLLPQMTAILAQDLPLEQKVQQISDFYNEMLLETPLLPVFVLNYVQSDPEALTKRMISVNASKLMSHLTEQLAQETKAGRIRDVAPQQLIINLLALCVFPYAMKPIVTRLFHMSEDDFRGFSESRKQVVPEVIMAYLKP
jgi:TetR/AcrR family transcriptional regulator